jgi:hypothetical protein
VRVGPGGGWWGGVLAKSWVCFTRVLMVTVGPALLQCMVCCLLAVTCRADRLPVVLVVLEVGAVGVFDDVVSFGCCACASVGVLELATVAVTLQYPCPPLPVGGGGCTGEGV